MFKYVLEQVVWYLEENTIHSAPILSRICVENLHEDWAYTVEQKQSFTRFGNAKIEYATIHGQYIEAELFDSKLALINSLSKNADEPELHAQLVKNYMENMPRDCHLPEMSAEEKKEFLEMLKRPS